MATIGQRISYLEGEIDCWAAKPYFYKFKDRFSELKTEIDRGNEGYIHGIEVFVGAMETQVKFPGVDFFLYRAVRETRSAYDSLKESNNGEKDYIAGFGRAVSKVEAFKS